MKKSLLLFFLLANAFLANCGSTPRPTDLLARVDQEPIFVKDLVQAYVREGEKFGPEAIKEPKKFQQIKEKLLEDLIQKKILTLEAQKQGVVITDQELEEEIRKYKSRYSEKSFQKILEARHIDYAIWREVKRTNLALDHLIEEKLFKNIPVSKEEIQRYYEQNLEAFTRPESVHVRHILTDTQEKAEALHQQLQAGENFARLARDYSLAPDRLQGGNLGFISRGNYPEAFNLCFDLKPGELSPVVSSLYGFHIFKVIEKKPEARLPLEEVEAQIEDWLKTSKRQTAFENYYQDLRKKYKVEIKQKMLQKIQIKETTDEFAPTS